MLVNAMETAGVSGTFQFTCEKVMHVLRSNQDSLMAVLEAFVYDPLINWRLVTDESENRSSSPNKQHESKNPTKKKKNVSIYDGLSTSPLSPYTNSSSIKSLANSERSSGDIPEGSANDVNDKALQVVRRIEKKLTGRDFNENVTLTVKDQVLKLISQASSNERLSLLFQGWCGFW